MMRPQAVRNPGVQPLLRPADLPPARPLLPAAETILPYLQRIDAQRCYTNFGPLVGELEGRLAERFSEGADVVSVANATLGLTLALQTMDLEPGLVAIPSWTFVATAHAVLQAGLTPWMIDVDPETGALDPAAIMLALAPAPGPVRAVIPVAPHGRMVDVAAWARFRAQTGLPVLIDAAAAFDAATDAEVPLVVSLHATKALGLGEGGFVACRDADFVARVRALSTFGFRGSREAGTAATNAKLSEYSAAVGLAAMDQWPVTRRRLSLAAQRLRMALALTPEVSFQPGWGMQWVSSVCVVGLPVGSVDAVERSLAADGVQTRRWWGRGCHRQPAFAGLPQTDLPNTEALAECTLGVPFMVDMTQAEAERIAAALHGAVRG